MKVLIAEDDQFIREGLRELLEPEGYHCVIAQDGEIALQQYQTEQPELVLLDIMMPKLDGYSVCREIRKHDEDIPVIFITAKSEEVDQVLGLELGADDYIKKPFGTREVIARIRAVTRRRLRHLNQNNPEPLHTFRLGELVVHREELRAERQGQTMELSLRDINTLALLYEHKNKVVTRDMLFNACWGRDYLPSSRTLDQHISKLRKTIEIDPKEPQIIKTVHGVGYRYDE